jgi:hypothetical protein
MTRSGYGVLASVAAAAFTYWWRHHRAAARRVTTGAAMRGETIYRNTPEPTGLGGGPT